MGHSHGGGQPFEFAQRVTRAVWTIVGVCAVATVIALVVLWPRDTTDTVDSALVGSDPVAAQVVDREFVPCSFDPLLGCVDFTIVPSEGEFSGERLVLNQSLNTSIDDGDRILVLIDRFDGSTVTVSFFDFQRGTPMVMLLLGFVVVIVAFGGWRGVGALAGLVASLLVIITFALPALLAGSNSVAIALVTASVIAFVALFLAHGVDVSTAVALISTLAALLITGLLAWVFVWTSNFTGFADESVGFLDVFGAAIDPRGLLLAGILIGSLGVLDDVTVTQVSAVVELRRASPTDTVAELYRRGVRIGRDHISSTVNTLFLAYAGAALPLMLLFRQTGQGIGSVATREVVAVEIVRALVGSIGLVSAVPISTYLAALVATARDDDAPISMVEPHADGTLEAERPGGHV